MFINNCSGPPASLTVPVRITFSRAVLVQCVGMVGVDGRCKRCRQAVSTTSGMHWIDAATAR